MSDYFDDGMVNRQRLMWTLATRRQLERWEVFVAAWVADSIAKRSFPDADIWAAEMEHHFVLVAVRNLFRALDLPPASTVPTDPTLRDELTEARDLREHWVENAPVFHVTPRATQPRYPSGQRFAARNPDSGPYSWLAWTGKSGARITPHVFAPALHDLLDAVEAEVLGRDATLTRFVPPRAPSPWFLQNGEWWPR